jgi:hypothetical protein
VASNDPLILFYTTFFSKPVDFAHLKGVSGESSDIVERFTLDKRRIKEATAVVFHMPNFREAGDAFKYPGQFWVAWSMESRQNYKIMANPKILKHFDFTMTHETRSDVWTPYLPRISWWHETMSRPIPLKTGEAPLALFLSARLNNSGRLDLVNGLSQHIAIDSYGRFMHNRTMEGPDLGRETKLATIGRYKFCMAVENSSETDYVTEKIYDCFEAGTVPVYLGTANVDEFAPPGSYIDAADFNSPAAIAAYLKYLAETPRAYEEYFAWRSRPLPEVLAKRAQELETPLFVRLMRFIRRQVEKRPVKPAGSRTLPFGPRSYVSTRLRKWKKKVPR